MPLSLSVSIVLLGMPRCQSGAVVHDAPELSDAEFVDAALRDPSAFALIVYRYEAPLKRYVRRLLGRSTEAVEDVLQEVFLKVYVNLNDYDRGRPFSPWIYRIAHNEAVSALRRGRNDRLTISGEDGERLIASVMDGAPLQDRAHPERMEKRIMAAVADLDRRYRDVIVLRFLEEKSYEEISQILELPMGTVATLVSRGRERLRQVLSAIGLTPGAE